ncbi:OmpA family protein [Nitratireductor sp. B36]|uniref:OmpA family protein n=1 Tax=Nitratireductor sp. B36 TaxID=2762059 RepID=UPI001E4B1261|nr:OmpA family protein [Nitratireductor sp. B36]MCC5779257.1 OmpA family protein [Nitratireductor sp. B36]
MTTRKRIMTTTALGLLIAAAPLATQPSIATERSSGVVLAQAEKPKGMTEEAWRALLKKRGEKKQKDKDKAPAENEAAPASKPEPTSEPEATAPAAETQAEQPAAADEPGTQEEPGTDNAGAPEDAPSGLEAPEEQPTPPVEPEAAEETAPAESAPAEGESTSGAEEGTPDAGEGTASQPEAGSQPASDDTDLPAEATPSPSTEEPAEDQPVEEVAPAAQQPAEERSAEEEPSGKAEDAAPTPAEERTNEVIETQPESGNEPEAQEIEPLPENAAPVLDSEKEPEANGGAQSSAPAEASEAESAAEEENANAEAEPQQAPMPESDAEAQADAINPETLRSEIRNILEERGERIELGQTREERRERRRELRERRESAEVVREFNDNRTIIQINNQVFVESQDSDRLIREDDEVYYEELPRGRVREVVTRPNGVRLITVRNRYGDVIRRVRVTPDGREQVLVFVPDERLETVDRWHDPARELPPLRLTIPVSDYILEAERVEDPERYYTFLEKPPVEPVRRIYSLEEVKRSARLRDMVRRIDLDTVEFAFGSADIEESEIDELEAIATAIERMLDENPAETFLIEGHTDAVGSDLANLALSDRRAESVARALTDVFGIPPENLVTQGYGERYLKIDTQERERENRRVALRRITPLVAPVASAR